MITLNRFLILLAGAAIGALLLSASYITGSLTAPGAHAGTARPAPVLHGVIALAVTTPCADEDSINCYWDAHLQGNGYGHSFYSVRVGGLTPTGHRIRRDCIIYWDRSYNATYGQCYRVR